MALGAIPSDIVLPIWEEIDFAAFGKPFNDVLYGGAMPIRKAGKLEIKHRSRKDVIQNDWMDMYDATTDIELYGNSLKVLQTMYLLSRYGPYNMRFKTEDAKWFNFVDNGTNGNGPITMGNATGSVLLNHTMTYTCGSKDRSLHLKGAGGMYLAERKWLNDNSASGASGGVSGAAISGFSHIVYNVNDYAPPGILDVKIGSDSLGFLEDSTKITLDFKEMGKTATREQPILGYVDIKAEVSMWQSAFVEQAYLLAAVNKDKTVTFVLPPAGDASAGGDTANMQIICVNSVKVADDYQGDESKNIVKVIFEGRVRGNANILFDLTANTLTLNRSGYV